MYAFPLKPVMYLYTTYIRYYYVFLIIYKQFCKALERTADLKVYLESDFIILNSCSRTIK